MLERHARDGLERSTVLRRTKVLSTKCLTFPNARRSREIRRYHPQLAQSTAQSARARMLAQLWAMYIATFGQALEQSSRTACYGHWVCRPTRAKHMGTRQDETVSGYNTKSSLLLCSTPQLEAAKIPGFQASAHASSKPWLAIIIASSTRALGRRSKTCLVILMQSQLANPCWGMRRRPASCFFSWRLVRGPLG